MDIPSDTVKDAHSPDIRFGRLDALGQLNLFTMYLACQLGGYAHGTGKHIWDLETSDAEKALKYWFFCELFYILATSVLKVSIALFLLRIAVTPMHRWILRIFAVATMCFAIPYFLVVLLQCSPISFWWELKGTEGRCINATVIVDLTYVCSALNALADWTFGILPVFVVRDLQMNKRTKRVVMFLLGFAAMYVFHLGLIDALLKPANHNPARTVAVLPPSYACLTSTLSRTTKATFSGQQPTSPSGRPSKSASASPLLESPHCAHCTSDSCAQPASLSVAGTVLPWSRSKKQSRSATKQSAYSWRTRSENHALDEFRPRKDCAVTTTTVTAHAKSTSSSDDSFELRGKGSQEQIVSPDVSMGRDSMDAARPKLGKRAGGGSQWGGISKSVEFTTTEERELDAPHGADIEKDMPPLPAVVYERL
ncbi:hypothetical protein H2203_007269 [Taxawa tesnikishii (nom. ined.)]|nr:hypothetical protein H2203_007269 [Dothideales sp. JES 119]